MLLEVEHVRSGLASDDSTRDHAPCTFSGRRLRSAPMYPIGRHRRWVALVAAFALLLGAFAPAISAVIGPRHDQAYLEVCTAGGSMWVATSEGVADDEPSPMGSHGFKPCLFCGSHAAVPHGPPVAAVVFYVPHLTEARPPALLFAPRTLHAWTSAQPRAPPLSS
jgi:hypothetical protein